LTASFGYILPTSLLELFDASQRLNVHPSLLPRYRGAAPIQWTIVNGDNETGVTVQRLIEKGKGIDAGEIVGQTGGIVREESAFGGADMVGSLSRRMRLSDP
jgi:methionyl-tRNA formyltransferase